MLILRLSVKHSTFVLLMVLVVWLDTASSAQMELSSTRTTSSVTGGSTLTVPLPRTCTASMMRLLPREMLCLEPVTRLSMEHLLSMEQLPLPPETTPFQTMRMPGGQHAGWVPTEETIEGDLEVRGEEGGLAKSLNTTRERITLIRH